MSKQKYIVTEQHQLIDLNGTLVNFEISFMAKSTNAQPFEALVVDQNTLDNDSNLEFKEANKGVLAGKIVFDHNKYQNFFLILRSQKKCEVEVTIDKKSIPPRELPDHPSEEKEDPPVPVLSTENFKPNVRDVKSYFKFNWKLILTILVVLVVLILIWFYFNTNKTPNSPEPVPTSLLGPSTVSVSSKDSIPPFKPNATMLKESASGTHVPKVNDNLISRLNNLVVK